MHTTLIEIILWVGFVLLLWALRDSLLHIESVMEQHTALAQKNPPRRPYFSSPQSLREPIGHYLGRQIFRYAVIEGKDYCFDYAYPQGVLIHLTPGQRYVRPGLVYVACMPSNEVLCV